MPRKRMTGCGMPANILQQFIDLAYTKETDTAPPGYSIDKALSDERVKVYPKNNSKDVVVVHRGSEGLVDWVDNISYATQGKVKGTPSYNMHRVRHLKAVQKYGTENIIGVGHSRAGLYVQTLDKEFPMKEIITYNKAAGPTDILKILPKKQTDVRVGNDIVSLLTPTQFSGNRVVIPRTANLFDFKGAHAAPELSRLGTQYIGAGMGELMEKYQKQLKRVAKGYTYKGYAKKFPGIPQEDVIKTHMEIAKRMSGSGLTDDIARYLDKKLFQEKPVRKKIPEPWQIINTIPVRPTKPTIVSTSTALLDPEDSDWVSVPSYYIPEPEKKSGFGKIKK